MPKLIDAHTHVQLKQFNKDREEVISRSLERDIWMINVGTNRKDSQFAIELSENHPKGIYATIGQHPDETEEFDEIWYQKNIQKEKVVGIGECGLDYYRVDKDKFINERERQIELFQKHIELARDFNKPLVIHCREAFSDIKKIIKDEISGIESNPGILHFFTGTKEDAKFFADLGFSFTFGGLITFNREFDETIKYLPLSKLLVETDAPFVAPAPYRGQRNEPAYVEEVAKAIGGIKGKTFEEVCQQTVKNTRDIFGI